MGISDSVGVTVTRRKSRFVPKLPRALKKAIEIAIDIAPATNRHVTAVVLNAKSLFQAMLGCTPSSRS